MVRHWHSFFIILAGLLFAAGISLAQPPTQATLSGAYNVRYLGVNSTPADSAVSFSGTITFDGNGGFTVRGTGASASTSDHTLQFQTTGQYQVLSNGMVQLTNPFDPSGSPSLDSFPNTVLYGGLGNGYITASSTDTLYSDIFIAVKPGSGASNAALKGNYQVASLEFLGGDFSQTRDTFFGITADGSGSLGNVAVKGTAQSLNDADTTQTSSGATYSVTANGTGTMNFPAPSGVTAANTLLSGNKTLYVSADGKFFVAGGTSTYDMVVGVQSAPGASLSGFYFTAYLENYAAGTNSDGIYSEQGGSTILSNGTDELAHQRINEDGFDSYDSTFYDQFDFDANGILMLDDSYWANGAGGSFVLGAGRGSNYQLVIYMKSIPMNLTGNYLNPQGIVNAASSIPFTNSFAPGEFITLYGNGFTNSTVTSGLPFPTSLGGVTVTVNGTPAPLYLVSSGQINAIIPYSAPSDGSLLEIKVNNIPNSTWVYSGPTDPGVYTYPTPGGIGVGAMIHNSNGTIVTKDNPAVAGEAIQIYCSGLGSVTPTVTTGAAASSTQISNTDNPVGVYIDGVSAKVLFAGLAPTFGGLYQINVTIPSGLSSGDHTLEIATNYSDNYQATIPIK